VGDRVAIGAGAKILGPVTVGSGSRVGANAVLLRSVPEGSVVVGVPGQVIASSGRPVKFPGDDASAPDPVGATVKSLLARVARLEEQLTGHAEHRPLHMPAVGVWEFHDYSI
jgi:serine O-acetyltransferase